MLNLKSTGNGKKNLTISTRVYFFIIPGIFIVFLTGLYAICSHNKNVREIKIVVNYPLVNEKGELKNLPDTVPILYYKNFILCQLPYQYLFTRNGILKGERKNYRLFFYKQGDLYGTLYDSITTDIKNSGTRCLVDSIMRRNVYKTDFTTIADSLQLYSSEKNNISILEKYIYTTRIVEDSFDSIFLFYDKRLNWVDYSWSRRLDSSKGMKLYKIKIFFNTKASDLYKLTMPKREFSYEILSCKKEPSLSIVSFVKKLSKNYNVSSH